MRAQEIIYEVESVGGLLHLEGEQIRYELPPAAVALLADLRANREGILNVLRSRESRPAMPTGIRLARWQPKRAPVALTRVTVVIDTHSFINRTLGELATAMAGSNSVEQRFQVHELIQRLEQVGVRVELEQQGNRRGTGGHQ